ERSLLHVADDADDGVPRSVSRADVNPLADEVGAGELPRNRFADEGGGRRAGGVVVRIEEPASAERNSNRFDVARAHGVTECRQSSPKAVVVGPRFEEHAILAGVAAQ